MYIIPWEKHMNDFYSQVAIHKKQTIKKQTSEYSEQMSFLMHRNQWLKIIQALSMVWCFLIS